MACFYTYYIQNCFSGGTGIEAIDRIARDFFDVTASDGSNGLCTHICRAF